MSRLNSISELRLLSAAIRVPAEVRAAMSNTPDARAGTKVPISVNPLHIAGLIDDNSDRDAVGVRTSAQRAKTTNRGKREFGVRQRGSGPAEFTSDVGCLMLHPG